MNNYPPGYSYLWNFGSGATPATSTLQNPTNIVYSTSGAKTVTLTITSGSCSGTKTNVITINPSPSATFTSNAPQCTGSEVSFTNTGSTGAGTTYFWDFGAGASPATSTSENPSGIIYSTAGTKIVTHTVTNNFGCATSATQTITINQTPTASFSSTAPQCTGLPVDFTNTGTVVGVTWAWNFGAGATPATSTIQSPTGIIYSTPGTKVVSLVTTNLTTLCTDSVSMTININLTPTVSFVSTAPQCQGNTVNFTNTGSTGIGFSYFWDLGQNAIPATSTTENPVGVLYSSSGTKTVTLTVNKGGCSASVIQSITINQKPTANFASTAPECTGLNVDFTNTGSTGGSWTYSWNFGSGATPATSALENPSGVVYSSSGTKLVKLVVTDGTCSDSITYTINIYQSPTVSFTSTEPECAGTGVDFINTGSTGSSWSYFWDFGQDAIPATSSTENPVGVLYGSYGTKTVTFTISNGNCTETTTGTITINETPIAAFTSISSNCTGDSVDFTNTGTSAALAINIVNITDATCNGSCNGTFISSASGGTTPYTYQWSNGQTTPTATGLCAGTYAVTVTDNLGVTITNSGTITQPDVLTAVISSQINVTCNGGADGSVDYTVTGGVSPYTYNWSNGAITEDITGLTAGTYSVTITDNNGCTTNQSVTITQPTAITVATTSTDATCLFSDGTASVTSSGGAGSHTYLWSDGQTTAIDSFLTAGTYTVTVTDTAGCTNIATAFVNNTGAPSITLDSASTLNCSYDCNGIAIVSASGGVPPYTFLWNDPAATANDTVNNLCAGTYAVAVTDNAGCLSNLSVAINASATVSVSAIISNVSCNGGNNGAIDITITGGISPYTYNWSNSATTEDISGLLPATYSVTVTDANSCTATLTGDITEPAALSANTSSSPAIDINCNGSATVTGSDGTTPYSYLWSNSSTTAAINNLCAATYSVTITDANGCTNTAIETVANSLSGVPIYSWNFGSGASPATSVSANPANVVYSTPGTKTVVLITTLGSCSDTSVQTINITETPAPAFTHTAPQCEGAFVDFTYTGTIDTNWTYAWDFGTGAYPSNSTQKNPPSVVYTGFGSKTVLLTVSNGLCSEVATATFTINQTPEADFTSNSSYCTYDSVDFQNTGTTGATYEWTLGLGVTPATSTDENPQNVYYSTGGIKTIELVTTLGSCTDTSIQTLNITETPAPSFTHTAPQCEGAFVDFTYTGTTDTNWTYTWDFGTGAYPSNSTQKNPPSVVYTGFGSKTVLLTVSNGMCSEVASATFTINQTPVADFTFISSNSINCTGDSVDFLNTGTTGAIYDWNFDSGAIPATSTTESPQNIVYSS
ncbi:MAG: PKD domain-containing protein, partial [Nitrospirae bacterium]|nr:PKD domain-containing protein [Nitrospirota bacterium]